MAAATTALPSSITRWPSAPTGSIFKPFVYATAFNTSLNGTNLGSGPFTAVTRLNDDPQDFGNGYVPGNFERGEYPGMVTAADALAHSLNIATIALGQQVGFGNVAALARSAGIVNAKGTPSVAIGTYNATPIDMAGAYTTFANSGVHLTPWTLASVRNTNGDIVADFAPVASQVLDPRVAYLTQSLLEGVMSRGTAASVRAHGFTAPAAGKTGTSHDVWFAGYSSNLLCIIWVGNDDYTDISNGLTHKLQGADTAAPIWAEFMKRAITLPQYSDVTAFTKPDGVTNVRIDKASGLPADASCPNDFTAAFLDGTIPAGTCSRMSDSSQGILNILNGTNASPSPTSPDSPQYPDSTDPAIPPTKHRGFLKRLFNPNSGTPPTPTPTAVNRPSIHPSLPFPPSWDGALIRQPTSSYQRIPHEPARPPQLEAGSPVPPPRRLRPGSHRVRSHRLLHRCRRRSRHPRCRRLRLQRHQHRRQRAHLRPLSVAFASAVALALLLSFRSEAEESASVLALALVLFLVIPQRSRSICFRFAVPRHLALRCPKLTRPPGIPSLKFRSAWIPT